MSMFPLILAVFLAAIIFLWFCKAKKILQERKAMVESARQQLDDLRSRASAGSTPPQEAVLVRGEHIYRQATDLYHQALESVWIRIPALVLGYHSVKKEDSILRKKPKQNDTTDRSKGDETMEKKADKKQIMFGMFGVGEAPEAAEPAEELEKAVKPAVPASSNRVMPASEPQREVRAMSFLSEDVVFEGSMRTEGDLEISGRFKGDIVSKGSVTLRSDVQGNVTAKSLHLSGCTLTGDVVAEGTVIINQDSAIRGNLSAKDVCCAGRIFGDLTITANTSLEETAQVDGVITTGTMTVCKGAVIQGGIKIGAVNK